MSRIEAELCETMSFGMFVTMVVGLYDPQRHTVRLANAGHLPLLRVRPTTGDVEWLATGGTAIGLLPDVEFETVQVDVEPGDVFVF